MNAKQNPHSVFSLAAQMLDRGTPQCSVSEFLSGKTENNVDTGPETAKTYPAKCSESLIWSQKSKVTVHPLCMIPPWPFYSCFIGTLTELQLKIFYRHEKTNSFSIICHSALEVRIHPGGSCRSPTQTTPTASPSAAIGSHV